MEKGRTPTPNPKQGILGTVRREGLHGRRGEFMVGSGLGEKLESHIGTSLPGALNAKSLEFLHSY